MFAVSFFSMYIARAFSPSFCAFAKSPESSASSAESSSASAWLISPLATSALLPPPPQDTAVSMAAIYRMMQVRFIDVCFPVPTVSWHSACEMVVQVKSLGGNLEYGKRQHEPPLPHIFVYGVDHPPLQVAPRCKSRDAGQREGNVCRRR